MSIDITSIILGVLSTGCLSYILFFREKKKLEQISVDKARAETEALQSNEWQDLYFEMKKNNESKSGLIDRLYDENSKFRDENNSLTTQIAVLKLLKCETRGCDKRVPPRGY